MKWMNENPAIFHMIQFIVTLIFCQAVILIIVKILQDNNREDEIFPFDKQFTAIVAFIRLIKSTESSHKRSLYLFILLLLIVFLIYLLYIFFKWGPVLFGGLFFD
jgi:hypothetical protein